jgi:hypothetical protein
MNIPGAIHHVRAYLLGSSGYLSRSEEMPHRRRIKKGSFDGHFDELVKHFPGPDAKPAPGEAERNPKERADIHAALFAGAWEREKTHRRD